jgi:hypothetical protein
MAGLAETWSNIEVRSVIRFRHQKGTSPAEIHRQFVEVYGANVMSRKKVWVWCTAFDNGRTDIQDEQRSGRPSTSTTDDNFCRIEGLIQEDRRIRVSDISDELNISVGDYTYMYELNKFTQCEVLLPYLLNRPRNIR